VAKRRVTGAELVAARLQNLGQISNSTTREILRGGALAIRDLARDYAPRKSGTLEDSIEVVEEGGAGERKTFVVGVNMDRVNPGGYAVEEYAEEMHDNYDAYRPGPGTRAKRAQGLKAGGYYLFRAGKELAPAIIRRVKQAVERAVARSTK
jgi:hypothetical protein